MNDRIRRSAQSQQCSNRAVEGARRQNARWPEILRTSCTIRLRRAVAAAATRIRGGIEAVPAASSRVLPTATSCRSVPIVLHAPTPAVTAVSCHSSIDSRPAKFVRVFPEVGSGTDGIPPVTNRPRPPLSGSQADWRGCGHQLSGCRLVAVAKQDHAVDRIGSQRFFRHPSPSDAIEHRRWLLNSYPARW